MVVKAVDDNYSVGQVVSDEEQPVKRRSFVGVVGLLVALGQRVAEISLPDTAVVVVVVAVVTVAACDRI